MSVLGVLFALGEKVCFTVLRGFKKYDRVAQCGTVNLPVCKNMNF